MYRHKTIYDLDKDLNNSPNRIPIYLYVSFYDLNNMKNGCFEKL